MNWTLIILDLIVWVLAVDVLRTGTTKFDRITGIIWLIISTALIIKFIIIAWGPLLQPHSF
jgi:hypothetical protein